MFAWKRLIALAIVSVSWLLLLAIGQAVMAFNSTPDTDPWVLLEAEEFADTNFPHASRSTRGKFCYTRRSVGYDMCGGDEYLLFLSGQQGWPFDPPGYWYADYALHVPAPGDYGHVWLALSPHDAAFSWSVDAQSPITATVVETAPPYGSPTFHWVRLDPTGLDYEPDPQRQPPHPHPAPRRSRSALVAHGCHRAHHRRDLDPVGHREAAGGPLLSRSLPRLCPLHPKLSGAHPARYRARSPRDHHHHINTSTLATPGEYEPLSFAIYARQSLSDVAVSLTDLIMSSPSQCLT